VKIMNAVFGKNWRLRWGLLLIAWGLWHSFP